MIITKCKTRQCNTQTLNPMQLECGNSGLGGWTRAIIAGILNGVLELVSDVESSR